MYMMMVMKITLMVMKNLMIMFVMSILAYIRRSYNLSMSGITLRGSPHKGGQAYINISSIIIIIVIIIINNHLDNHFHLHLHHEHKQYQVPIKICLSHCWDFVDVTIVI